MFSCGSYSFSNKAKGTTSSSPYSAHNVMSPAMVHAEEFRASLSAEFPSFSKRVLRSHIRKCFIMPEHIREALPKHNNSVVLVDENGQEYKTRYSVQRHQLDTGWRAFSKAHNLLEGDALVFHLIDYCKFKVYIVRATEANQILAPLEADFHAIPIDYDDQLVSDNEHNGSVTTVSTICLESVEKFKELNEFEDFSICVGGLILDSEIPTPIRKKYYDLCCSQMMFLHCSLVEGLSSNLVVNMISETISIVDAIRAANIDTPLHNLTCWDKTLQGFEVLGLSVGFLRTWLHKLIRLSEESKKITESKREKTAQVDQEIEALKASILKVKEMMDGWESEVVCLEKQNDELGFEFVKLAGAI